MSEDLIAVYSSSHQDKTNQLIHYVCVPVIFLNVVAFVYYYLPLPVLAVVVGATLVFYYRRMRPFLPLMIVLYSISLATSAVFASHPLFLKVNLGLFVAAWIGQFWGHKIEGKNPSFFQNLFFLLVGPAWVMEKLRAKAAASRT